MNKQPNRKAIWVSAAITLLVMGLASMLVFGPTWLSASSRETATTAAAPLQTRVLQGAGPNEAVIAATDADTQALIAEYQVKLDQAYQALQDAYAQIQMLQQAQGQGRFRSDDGPRGRSTAPFSGASTQQGVAHD